jgi:uncharacterized membrane protein
MQQASAAARGLRIGGWVVPPLTVVLAATALGVLVNWLQKYPCHGGNFGEGRALRFACYTDVLALHSAHGLGEGAVPYLDRPVEYPVLTGMLMALIGLPVNAAQESGLLRALFAGLGLGEPGEGTVYYDLIALVLALCALATTYAIARTRPHRPYDALLFAFSPGLLLAATVNFDLLAVGLTALGILAWARRQPILAGVLLGLASCAKFYPFLLLGPLVLLCLRKRTADAVYSSIGTVAAAVATWSAVNLPVALIAPEGWWRFYRFSSERGVDWGSFWYIGDHLPLRESGADRFFGRLVGDVGTLNLVAWAFFAACCIGIAALIWFAPRRPRLGAMAFLVVAAFLLTNKVWSQQFVLWLIPLAVLARPRWGLFLVWQATEVVYFLSFYQVQLHGGEVEFALVQAAVLRWLAVALFCGFVVTEALRPTLDVVRRDGVDDPEGGALTDEPPGPSPPDPAAGEREAVAGPLPDVTGPAPPDAPLALPGPR